MKALLFLLFTIFSFSAGAQHQANGKNLAGKTIYCFKTVSISNKEGTKSSFAEPNSYPYLLKIDFQNNGTYNTSNRLREHVEDGKYRLSSNLITLTTSSAGSKTTYQILFQQDGYITLKLKDTLLYCLID